MSDPVRVGAVVEGPTDKVMLQHVLPKILGCSVTVTMLQPTDESVAFSQGGASGFGWRGVLRWCDEIRGAGGVASSGVLTNLDVLVVHLDGDVAGDRDIHLARPCPPAADTADELRALLLRRLGDVTPPPKTVLVVPMQATETWLLALFRPKEAVEECEASPQDRLKGGKPKLLDQSGKKLRPRYEQAFREIPWSWDSAGGLSQAARFESEVRAVVVRNALPAVP